MPTEIFHLTFSTERVNYWLWMCSCSWVCMCAFVCVWMSMWGWGWGDMSEFWGGVCVWGGDVYVCTADCGVCYEFITGRSHHIFCVCVYVYMRLWEREIEWWPSLWRHVFVYWCLQRPSCGWEAYGAGRFAPRGNDHSDLLPVKGNNH